jgi:hypothetical protein
MVFFLALAKAMAIQRRLRPGMLISYFDEAQNRLIKALVLELHRTCLLVENRLDNQRWSIPFGAVNIDGVDTDIRAIAPEQRALDRSRLKVGDAVGFRDRQNHDKYGRGGAKSENGDDLSHR